MKLKQAATFFDTCPVYDAYTGAALFKIQASTFLDSAAEGSTSAKRVISVAPGRSFPAHSAVLVLGQLTLVGGVANADEWAGGTIRATYWTKRVTDDFRVLTPGEAALKAAGIPAFGHKEWLREAINTYTDANLDPQYSISLSHNQALKAGYFLRSANTLFRVRNTQIDLGGFRTSICDEVDEDVCTVVLAASPVLNPVTDTYTTGTVNTTAVVLDYSKAFTYKTPEDHKPLKGDVSLILSKLGAGAITAGMTLKIEDSASFAGNWRVLNYLDEADSWNAHIRRV